MGDQVVPHHAALGVHEIHAHRVVVEAVAFDDVVVGEHEVDRVAAAHADIAAVDIFVGIPGHHVARIGHLVALDQVAVAVPQAQAVAAHAQLARLGTNLVVANHAVARLLEVDAEQAVVDHQVLDHVAVAAHVEAGIIGVVRIAGTGQVQPAQHRTIGLEGEHRAPVAGIDGDLAAAFDDQRLGHHHRPGIAARRRTQRGTRRRRIDQVLEGLEAMDALVALVERKGGLRPIDADPRCRGQIGRRPQGRRLVFVAIGRAGYQQRGNTEQQGRQQDPPAFQLHGGISLSMGRASAGAAATAPLPGRRTQPAAARSPSRDRNRSRTAPPCLRRIPSA